jgi:hypothetical protein
MVSPVGTITRVAVLLDTVPTNYGLDVKEWSDSVDLHGIFEWASGIPTPVINQWEDGGLTPSINYVSGRCASGGGGCTYVYSGDGFMLNGGNAANIPPLQLAPSQICFPAPCQ